MKLTELSGASYVLDMVGQRETANPRAPGPHLSNIVQSLVKAMRMVKTYDNDDDGGELQPLFWEMGCAWEAAITKVLAARYTGGCKPEPRQYDGVWCSPDWYRPWSRTIDEIKLTWTKYKGLDHPKIQTYLWQLKAYMHVWNCRRGVLHVGHVRGNYADRPVMYQVYLVRCTPLELEEHWNDLIAHGRDVCILT